MPSNRRSTCSTGLPSTTIGVTKAWEPRAASIYVSAEPKYPEAPCWKLSVVGPLWQIPVPGLQVSPTGQLTAVPVHVPPAHTSPVVHRFPSLHEPVLLTCWHDPAEHESSVQTLPSSQLTAACWHPSSGSQLSVVQASPSSQSIGACVHCPLEHVSIVHGSLSAQLSALPRQTPLTQTSFVVQALPSLQTTPDRGACEHDPRVQASTVHGLWSSQSTGVCTHPVV